MRRIPISLLCFALCLGGCDTAYGIRANADYSTKIDVKCVEGALRKAFGQVHRWDYVHGGGAGTFPAGSLRTSERRLKCSRCGGKEAWLTILPPL